jgi:hypothetical protein
MRILIATYETPAEAAYKAINAFVRIMILILIMVEYFGPYEVFNEEWLMYVRVFCILFLVANIVYIVTRNTAQQLRAMYDELFSNVLVCIVAIIIIYLSSKYLHPVPIAIMIVSIITWVGIQWGLWNHRLKNTHTL